MIVRCIDFESTGIPAEGDIHSLVEFGYVDLDTETWRIAEPVSGLVKPARKITIGARAVHHISDAEAETGISPTAALQILVDGPHSYYCAHLSDFEKNFFGGGEIPWLDTYKCGLRIWTEAEGHSLQMLRYHLGVDEDPDFNPALAARPHRAGDDAYVCAFVLRRLLKAEPDTAKLVRWSNGPALLHMCFMKKHKGKPWAQVAREDRDYLDWIANKSDITDRDIRATARYWLKQTEGGKSYA